MGFFSTFPDKEWTYLNPLARLEAMRWGGVWYQQMRSRKGNWIACDQRQEVEAWNG